MTSTKVKPPGGAEIVVNGQWGTFSLRGGDATVNYFQTYASPSALTGGAHYELLKQLAPMRERVASAELKDLDSLLQRDLSDERIAQELVPYLYGSRSKVGFFPPIVAVLMPKGFVSETTPTSHDYPPPKSVDASHIKYSNFWRLERYLDDGVEVGRLGQLTINQHITDIIVLDGQHRANAFRYVAGCFTPGPIYSPFYEGLSKLDPPLSDLPITVIWFDPQGKGKKITPKQISRELFVTVNNSVREVSEARTVLLNDVDIVPIAVNTYYRDLAANAGYSGDGLDLLGAFFDMDRELSDASVPPMALTTPVHLRHALSNAFWANLKCDELIDRAPKGKHNPVRFTRIFGNPKYLPKGDDAMRILDSKQVESFRNDFRIKYRPVLQALFSGTVLSTIHHDARRKLVTFLESDKASTVKTDWWNHAYLGGEGLYGAYMASQLESCKSVKKVLGEIDGDFVRIRNEEALARIPKADRNDEDTWARRTQQVFETFRTEAFQTGFVMTVDWIAREQFGSNYVKAAGDVARRMKKITMAQWATFFDEFKEWYVPGLDPASWPLFRKMLFVLLDYDWVFKKALEDSPAYSMIGERVKDSARTFLVAHDGKLTPAQVTKIVDAAIGDAKLVYEGVGRHLTKVKALGEMAYSEIEAAKSAYAGDE